MTEPGRAPAEVEVEIGDLVFLPLYARLKFESLRQLIIQTHPLIGVAIENGIAVDLGRRIPEQYPLRKIGSLSLEQTVEIVATGMELDNLDGAVEVLRAEAAKGPARRYAF